MATVQSFAPPGFSVVSLHAARFNSPARVNAAALLKELGSANGRALRGERSKRSGGPAA